MLRKMGAVVCSTPAEAAKDTNLVMVCVFTAAQAKRVLFGDKDSGDAGAVETLRAGGTVCLHTSVAPDDAHKLELRLRKTNHHFLDAPIIGGKVGADTGTLTIVASGDDEAIDAATNPLRQVGERFFRCGDRAGAASSVKMIDTMLIGIHTVAGKQMHHPSPRRRRRMTPSCRWAAARMAWLTGFRLCVCVVAWPDSRGGYGLCGEGRMLALLGTRSSPARHGHLQGL